MTRDNARSLLLELELAVITLASLDAAIIFRTEQAHDAWWAVKAALDRLAPGQDYEHCRQTALFGNSGE